MEYFDASFPGLALRITENGSKSWCAFYRFHGRLRRLTMWIERLRTGLPLFLDAAHPHAVASGAPARPGRECLERRHPEIPAARSRPANSTAARRPPSVALARTEGAHIAGPSATGSTQFQAARSAATTSRPTGNAVNLEDEMIKVAANQMDYQAATTLYQRSLGLLKTAVGKR